MLEPGAFHVWPFDWQQALPALKYMGAADPARSTAAASELFCQKVWSDLRHAVTLMQEPVAFLFCSDLQDSLHMKAFYHLPMCRGRDLRHLLVRGAL